MIDVDYDKWADFIVKYLDSVGLNPIGKKSLELGCGTGNMTTRLKDRGMDIIALDISQDMLTAAEEKARKKRQRIMFVNQDMTQFKINKNFDLIFSFCDGYNYIIEEQGLISSFERVYRHLAPGGSFIFDISTAHKLKNVIGNNTFTTNSDELCYIWDNYLEGDLLEMYITFFLQESSLGGLYRRIDETHVQRAYDADFIVSSLKRCGFNNVEVYDDYTFETLNEESTRATFVAKK
jgi:ubiquinone/menaquinone biosynthesis C-methylase UbiE